MIGKRMIGGNCRRTKCMLVSLSAITLATFFSTQLFLSLTAHFMLMILIFQTLRNAQFSSTQSYALVFLTWLHAGLFQSLFEQSTDIWLAVAIFLTASSAARFAQSPDPRNVMLLSLSLCIAQWLHPLGIMLTILLLPLSIILPRQEAAPHKAGLFTLLLFPPVFTALLLAYLDRHYGLSLHQLLQTDTPTNSIPLWLQLTAAILTTPVLWLSLLVRRLKQDASLMVLYTALSILLAGAVAGLLDRGLTLISLLSCMACLSTLCLSVWRRASAHIDLALTATALGTMLSWLLLALLQIPYL